MEIIVKLPSECSDYEVSEFIRMVIQGGEVDSYGLEQRINRAEKLFFLKSPELAGVCAIKRPYHYYRDSVFEQAGSGDKAGSYQLELGWMYINPAARGQNYSRRLLEAMIRQLKGKGCYALTRSNNQAINHILGQYGFRKAGAEYPSQRGDYQLILYTRPGK